MKNLNLEVKKLEARETKSTGCSGPCLEYYWNGICLELGWTISLPCC